MKKISIITATIVALAALTGCAITSLETGKNQAKRGQMSMRPTNIKIVKVEAPTPPPTPEPITEEPILPAPTPTPEPEPVKAESQMPPPWAKRLEMLERKVAGIDNRLGQLAAGVRQLSLRTREVKSEYVRYYIGPFAEGRTDAKAFKKSIGDVATLIKKGEVELVKIEGFSDKKGKEKKNQALSKERAFNTAAVLLDLGVDTSTVPVTGEGIIAELGTCPDNRAVLITCRKK